MSTRSSTCAPPAPCATTGLPLRGRPDLRDRVRGHGTAASRSPPATRAIEWNRSGNRRCTRARPSSSSSRTQPTLRRRSSTQSTSRRHSGDAIGEYRLSLTRRPRRRRPAPLKRPNFNQDLTVNGLMYDLVDVYTPTGTTRNGFITLFRSASDEAPATPPAATSASSASCSSSPPDTHPLSTLAIGVHRSFPRHQTPAARRNEPIRHVAPNSERR